MSDDKLREASGLISNVLASSSVKDQKRITKHLDEAVNQIKIALSIKLMEKDGSALFVPAENHHVERDHPATGDEQCREARQINKRQFTAVSAGQGRLMHHQKCYEQVYHQRQCGKPRQQPDGQQRGSDDFGEHHERQAHGMADAEWVRKGRSLVVKINELVEAVVEKHRRSQPESHHKQGQIGCR